MALAAVVMQDGNTTSVAFNGRVGHMVSTQLQESEDQRAGHSAVAHDDGPLGRIGQILFPEAFRPGLLRPRGRSEGTPGLFGKV